MQALIVHDDPDEIHRMRLLLARRGYEIMQTADQAVGVVLARHHPVDLLILKLRIEGKHTTSVALAAEYRNPDVATLLLATGAREDLVEQFELVPSLRAILDTRPDKALLSALMTAAVGAQDDALLVLTQEHSVPASKPPLDLPFISSRAA